MEKVNSRPEEQESVLNYDENNESSLDKLISRDRITQLVRIGIMFLLCSSLPASKVNAGGFCNRLIPREIKIHNLVINPEIKLTNHGEKENSYENSDNETDKTIQNIINETGLDRIFMGLENNPNFKREALVNCRIGSIDSDFHYFSELFVANDKMKHFFASYLLASHGNNRETIYASSLSSFFTGNMKNMSKELIDVNVIRGSLVDIVNISNSSSVQLEERVPEVFQINLLIGEIDQLTNLYIKEGKLNQEFLLKGLAESIGEVLSYSKGYVIKQDNSFVKNRELDYGDILKLFSKRQVDIVEGLLESSQEGFKIKSDPLCVKLIELYECIGKLSFKIKRWKLDNKDLIAGAVGSSAYVIHDFQRSYDIFGNLSQEFEPLPQSDIFALLNVNFQDKQKNKKVVKKQLTIKTNY